jgi:hypothetical protein
VWRARGRRGAPSLRGLRTPPLDQFAPFGDHADLTCHLVYVNANIAHGWSLVCADALEYAEKMTTTGGKVGDELWARRRRHFTESQMVELTATVALENFRSKFNVPFQIESQGFCVPRPPGAPAPP